MKRKPDIRRPAQQQPPSPKPVREVMAPPCTLCAAQRPEGKNYSRIYATRQHSSGAFKRYVRCHFCGNAWVIVAATRFVGVDKPGDSAGESTHKS